MTSGAEVKFQHHVGKVVVLFFGRKNIVPPP